MRVEELRRAGLPVLPPVVRVDRDRPLPLSFAQERLWFIDRLEGGSAPYNIPDALRLTGALDVDALERSLGEIVRRHESLRTVFAEVDGGAVQVIAPFAGFALPVDDLSGLDEPAREAEVRRRAREDAARPFDLARGPLFRAALLRMADEEHVLLLCIHHIVSDGWSSGVLFRELDALYAAYRDGGDSPLAELPVQYADYAVWQREQLAGEVLDRQVGYWKERLAGAPALLELPDRPAPAAGAVAPRRAGAVRSAARAAGPSPGAGPRRGRDAVHGDAGRLPAAAVEVQRQRGHRRRQPDRGADEEGGGGADRLLRQHARPAHRPLGRSDLPRAAGARARGDAGRVRAPGGAVRAAGGRAAARALPEPRAALPGDVRAAERRRLRLRPRGAADGGGGRGVGDHQVRPGALRHLARRRHLRRAGVQHRPLRPLHRPADAGAPGAGAGAGRRGRGRAALAAGAARRGGARAGGGGVEPDAKPSIPADRCIHELFEAQAARTPYAVAVRFEEASLTYAS